MIRRFLYLCSVIVVVMTAKEGLTLMYRYYDLKNHLAQTLKTADLETDSEIRKKVAERAKRSGVQSVEQDIVVRRGQGHVVVEMPYRHDVQLTMLGRRYTILHANGSQ